MPELRRDTFDQDAGGAALSATVPVVIRESTGGPTLGAILDARVGVYSVTRPNALTPAMLYAEHGVRVRQAVGKLRRPPGVERGDLESAAWVEVLGALPDYDPTRQSIDKWVTWWAMKGARAWLADHRRPTRLPAGVVRRERAVARCDNRAMALDGRPATDAELAEVGLERPQLGPVAQPVSMSEPIRSADDATVGDTVASGAPGPEHEATVAERGQRLRNALEGLGARERAVVVALFGFDGSEPQNPREVSEKLGCSRQRVEQLRARAFERLRERVGDLGADP